MRKKLKIQHLGSRNLGIGCESWQHQRTGHACEHASTSVRPVGDVRPRRGRFRGCKYAFSPGSVLHSAKATVEPDSQSLHTAKPRCSVCKVANVSVGIHLLDVAPELASSFGISSLMRLIAFPDPRAKQPQVSLGVVHPSSSVHCLFGSRAAARTDDVALRL